jgi:UDP-glucose:(heptosyl)LPS alpha-1,3-glucosyltransferase
MLKVVHIVKRFGSVGGMERYVWELSHALARAGVEIHILCEEALPAEHENIYIHHLGKSAPKPRWISMLKFSYQVSQWRQQNSQHDYVIHSHERTSIHHVTTFHSALFAHVKKKPWWKKVSLRIAVWLYLEERELCGQQVQIVLPNSDLIHDELNQLYPQLSHHLFPPAYPAVNLSSYQKSKPTHEIILFIGQEWKRKGLKMAINIVEEIRKNKPAIELWVLGADPKEIQPLFDHWQTGYQLLGWRDSAPYIEKASLLLHPATDEPYGMAIAEAANNQVPVVVSDRCGIASQITPSSGQVIHVDAPIERWVTACREELDRTLPVKAIGKSWDELAEQHVQLYSKVKIT